MSDEDTSILSLCVIGALMAEKVTSGNLEVLRHAKQPRCGFIVPTRDDANRGGPLTLDSLAQRARQGPLFLLVGQQGLQNLPRGTANDSNLIGIALGESELRFVATNNDKLLSPPS